MGLFKRKHRAEAVEPEQQVDVAVSFRGCRFLLPRHWKTTQDLLAGKDYEPWVLDYFLECCKPGAKVLDAGASWGGFSLPAAKAVGAGGRVTAIEMLPDNARILLQSARASGLADTIRLLPLGLSDSLGSALMRRDLSSNNQVVATPADDEPLKGYEVLPVMSLDLLRSELGPVDVMKIDIEGMEYRAVMGGRAFLAESRPVVFLEYSPDYQRRISGPEGGDLLHVFLQLGYGVEILHRKAPRERVQAGTAQDVVTAVDAEWRLHCERDRGTHLDLCLTPAERA
jgi:FkbM family methyltransferase